MKHREEALRLLNRQIGNHAEVNEISATAEQVAKQWVQPLSGGRDQTNGLIYGLVQSGKTGVLTVTGAIAADEGYRTIIILTFDNDALYNQTLSRVKESLPGIDIIDKTHFKDTDLFLRRIRGTTCAIITTKNSRHLGTIIENFKKGNLRGLSVLIIDDEADQASLNTKEQKGDGSRSTINARLHELRQLFDKSSYIQVTATPQALFLQTPGHDFRPKFTVLSHPGSDYIGGEEFFGDNSKITRNFDINDLTILSPGSQPRPSLEMPRSLLQALDTFMVAATYKRKRDVRENCAFLCHVSTRKSDHDHIVGLLYEYKMKLAEDARKRRPVLVKRLHDAFEDLSGTHAGIRDVKFEAILEDVTSYAPGIAVKLVNSQTDEDVAVNSPYNLFVGGNKLGRGVTIKNLLVSYYGRNPKRPQADTVLQHARMYGYRKPDMGLLRLFLPDDLHKVFKAICKMEASLRDLVAQSPSEEFRGIYIEGSLNPTRKSVLAPGAIGAYTGGSIYNPAQVLRTEKVISSTRRIDELVSQLENRIPIEVPIERLRDLIKLTLPDPEASEKVWNAEAIAESIVQWAKLHKQETGYLYVDRDRGLKEKRRETQGILAGGEEKQVRNDKLTLFLLRTKGDLHSHEAWWPQVRFPKGRYAFAFAV